MNVRSVDIQESFETELQAALAINCRLSSEDLERITAFMQNSNFSFSQSALRLGVLTQGDVDVAIERLEQMNGAEKESLVETAIHKLSEQRQLVVHVAAPEPV